jgi:hypothetical protein
MPSNPVESAHARGMLSGVSKEVEDLHDALFGYRPAKAGTAYERLSAIVLATRGWHDVMHDVTETPPERLAAHQLDVTCRHPSGEAQRLIVECKDWNRTVGEATLNQIVGVRTQTGADSAIVITTEGFTAGAIAVAVDEDIALVRLRPFDQENPVPYVKTITLTIVIVSSTHTDLNVELMPGHSLALGTSPQVSAWTGDPLLHLDGSPAETLKDLLAEHGAKINDDEGPYHRHVSFADGRLLPVNGADPIPLAGLSWTETLHRSPHTTTTEAQGEPLLVLEQLDEDGTVDSGRIVIDTELYAWDIDSDGKVAPRGSLTGEDERVVLRREPQPPE